MAEMNNWRDHILKEFTPQVTRLTLVADPDGLLLEDGVLEGIQDLGFELVPFDDPVAFRYLYESKFRSFWDQGKETDVVVVLRTSESDLGKLPYDLLQAGRQLSFSLAELFPILSYPVVASLDRGYLDALYEAQQKHTHGIFGDNATKDFILLHVFEIAPELIKKPSDLLRVLLRRHYRNQRIPSMLDERLIQVLRQQKNFDDWPLEQIVPDREAFFVFLQERWPVFLEKFAEKDSLRVAQGEKRFEIPGPVELPFDHDDIRVYLDNLFLEGYLDTISHEQASSLKNLWISIGVRSDEKAERRRRLDGLLETLASEIPKTEDRHEEWSRFAKTLAEMIALAMGTEEALPEDLWQKMESIQKEVDEAFLSWLNKRYGGLVNLPPVPPVMLHHVPRFLARYVNESKENKAALLLVDGLSYDQWVVLRKEIAKQRPKFRFRENTVFAWVPTITSVSRQAVFAGKPPLFFPKSISTTGKEPELWSQFWADQGLTPLEIAYAKGLGDGSLDGVEEVLSGPKTRVVGLVIDKIDKIMHGMQLGTAGMHNQIRQWAGQQFLANLLDSLFEKGFKVYLTSDHGNVEAKGCGKPSEGMVADLRGVRARIYSDRLLRRQVKEKFPNAVEWPTVGLPEDYFPLLAPDRMAFVHKNERIVSHGGVSVEEVIVPFVEVERKDA